VYVSIQLDNSFLFTEYSSRHGD